MRMKRLYFDNSGGVDKIYKGIFIHDKTKIGSNVVKKNLSLQYPSIAITSVICMKLQKVSLRFFSTRKRVRVNI